MSRLATDDEIFTMFYNALPKTSNKFHQLCEKIRESIGPVAEIVKSPMINDPKAPKAEHISL